MQGNTREGGPLNFGDKNVSDNMARYDEAGEVLVGHPVDEKFRYEVRQVDDEYRVYVVGTTEHHGIFTHEDQAVGVAHALKIRDALFDLRRTGAVSIDIDTVLRIANEM